MTPAAKIADMYLQRGEKVTITPPQRNIAVVQTDAGVSVVKILEFSFYDMFNWPHGGLVPIAQADKWDETEHKPRHVWFISSDLSRWAFLQPDPEAQKWVKGNVEINAGEGPVAAYTCDAEHLTFGDL